MCTYQSMSYVERRALDTGIEWFSYEVDENGIPLAITEKVVLNPDIEDSLYSVLTIPPYECDCGEEFLTWDQAKNHFEDQDDDDDDGHYVWANPQPAN